MFEMPSHLEAKPYFKSILFTIAFSAFSLVVNGQIVGGNAYMIGDFVEIAIDGNGGHEGTADLPGSHSRGGWYEDIPYGFVANPQDDDWDEYNGDFFTAGSPENGFGLEINGTNYSNNGWNAITSTTFFSEIPVAPGGGITYESNDGCLTVEWTGLVAGVQINLKYNLIEDALFYTTEVTLTNVSGTNLSDVYYYRNVDPDNNAALSEVFATRNEIVSQPGPDCIKAQVSATQTLPHHSYLGFGALGENFRVSHGGFSNRSGSDIWNATGGLTGTVGDVTTYDKAISIAYKTDLAAGQSVNFTYAIVLDEDAVEQAFSSLYFINYVSEYDEGGGALNPCSPALVNVSSCAGNEVMLNIDGPNVDNYIWTWSPTGEVDDTIVVSPTEPILYSVTGVPTQACLTGLITKHVAVVFNIGPQIEITYPPMVCDSFDLRLLDYVDLNGGENVNCVFLTVQPDSATQTEPAFEGPMIGRHDEVYLMCGDTTTGCFDFTPLTFNWVGEGAAGRDSTLTMCTNGFTRIDMYNLLSDSANVFGNFRAIPENDRFDEATGVFNASGLSGIFEFIYFTEAFESCPADTSYFTIILEQSPIVAFELSIDGYVFEEGPVLSTCIVNTIDFDGTISVTEPATLADFFWTFGDGDSAFVEDPSHIYEEIGQYTIKLIGTSSNGCAGSAINTIKIYEEPPFELEYLNPICYRSEDGIVMISPLEEFGPFTGQIKDEDDILRNVVGIDTAYNCEAGFYYGSVEDMSGCMAYDTVQLINPPFMDIFYTVHNPSCTNDSGYVVVDSVVGESLNNPVRYVWNPNPAGIEGIGADSSYWMAAGDYSLTATDSKGCTNTVEFKLINPPPFYFTEWGSDTAYCRLYGYQSGNGLVYAGAAGGVPNYTYEWEYLEDGTTFNFSTWGGRNPGEHRITVTDDWGCVLTKIVTVDSVNPVAAFDIITTDLNENCEGTADVAVEFVNQSTYFANPNNPDADTLFFWDLDFTGNYDWTISHSFFETFDTIYKPRGESYNVEVCLIAFNKNQCSDTTCKIITIWEPPELDPVNIFSPNGDGINDVLTFVNYQKGIAQFNCVIVNRWGVKVGEIDGIANSWDGTDMTGDFCPDGVYFYTYSAVADNGQTFKGQGNVTLINSQKNK